jgi:hypothetical protein
MATRVNAVGVVLNPTDRGGATSELGGGVLFGMLTRYNKGAARFQSGGMPQSPAGAKLLPQSYFH